MKKIFFIASIIFCANASASIQVYPMLSTLDEGNQYTNSFKVFSNSNLTQYVKISVKQLINSGTKKQKEIEVSAVNNKGLIVSPQRLILASNSHRVVRILPQAIPKHETLYRVYVNAVLGDEDPILMENKKSSAEITVNISWGVLVYIEPNQPHVSFSYLKKDRLLRNDGNTRAKISQFGFCTSGKGCNWKPFNGTLYSGKTYQFNQSYQEAGNTLPLFVKYNMFDGSSHIQKIN